MSTSPDQIILTPEQKQRLAQLSDETGRRWDELLDEAWLRTGRRVRR